MQACDDDAPKGRRIKEYPSLQARRDQIDSFYSQTRMAAVFALLALLVPRQKTVRSEQFVPE